MPRYFFISLIFISALALLAACSSDVAKLEVPITHTPIVVTATVVTATVTPTPVPEETYIAARDANATRTARAHIPTSGPSVTRRPPGTMTPTLDYSQYEGWRRYKNTAYGISFEYPALFDTPLFRLWECDVKLSVGAGGANFEVGEDISLSIFDAGDESLDSYVDSVVDAFEDQGTLIVSREENIVGGARAITIGYRFGIGNRYGEITVLKHYKKFYPFESTGGHACMDIDEKGYFHGELDYTVYRRILDTFQFIKQE